MPKKYKVKTEPEVLRSRSSVNNLLDTFILTEEETSRCVIERAIKNGNYDFFKEHRDVKNVNNIIGSEVYVPKVAAIMMKHKNFKICDPGFKAGESFAVTGGARVRRLQL